MTMASESTMPAAESRAVLLAARQEEPASEEVPTAVGADDTVGADSRALIQKTIPMMRVGRRHRAQKAQKKRQLRHRLRRRGCAARVQGPRQRALPLAQCQSRLVTLGLPVHLRQPWFRWAMSPLQSIQLLLVMSAVH